LPTNFDIKENISKEELMIFGISSRKTTKLEIKYDPFWLGINVAPKIRKRKENFMRTANKI
jgi:hypothetical protein